MLHVVVEPARLVAHPAVKLFKLPMQGGRSQRLSKTYNYFCHHAAVVRRANWAANHNGVLCVSLI